MLTVNKISYLNNYKFKVSLSNGTDGIFDITPYLNKGVFTQLKKIGYLIQVKINFAGICWPNGQDFSADTIEYDMQHSYNTPNKKG